VLSTPACRRRMARVICIFSENLLLRGIFECGAREARGSVRLRVGAAAKACVMVRGFGL
jgi:hypothetical protein